MSKSKIPKKEITEQWWLDTADRVVAGYTYHGNRVFTVCAKNRQDARESMNSFIERNCS